LAKLTIRQEGDPVLRQKAKPVKKITRRIVKLMQDMEETMYANDGVGLAGPQVGVLEQLVVIDVGDGPVHLVNPRLVSGEGSEVDVEGCLSIPGVFGYVDRYEHVTVHALDEKGRQRKIKASELYARALQHEIDHLHGILFIDKATGIHRPEDDEKQDGERDEMADKQ